MIILNYFVPILVTIFFFVFLPVVAYRNSSKIIRFIIIGFYVFIFMGIFTPSLIPDFIPLDHPCESEENQNDPECLEYDD